MIRRTGRLTASAYPAIGVCSTPRRRKTPGETARFPGGFHFHRRRMRHRAAHAKATWLPISMTALTYPHPEGGGIPAASTRHAACESGRRRRLSLHADRAPPRHAVGVLKPGPRGVHLHLHGLFL